MAILEDDDREIVVPLFELRPGAPNGVTSSSALSCARMAGMPASVTARAAEVAAAVEAGVALAPALTPAQEEVDRKGRALVEWFLSIDNWTSSSIATLKSKIREIREQRE